jgi:hypothetical protein
MSEHRRPLWEPLAGFWFALLEAISVLACDQSSSAMVRDHWKPIIGDRQNADSIVEFCKRISAISDERSKLLSVWQCP